MTEKRAINADDLYRLRLISDPQISPDGSRVAFVLKQMNEEKDEYLSNIYVADRTGTVTQFTSGDKDSAPRWSPDGKYLAFLSGRKERAQIYLMSTSGGESRALTERKLGAGVPFWSPDSATIGFVGMVSTDPEEEAEEKDKKGDKKHKPKMKILDRSGYKMDGAGYIGNRRRHLFTVTVADREVTQLTEGDFNDEDLSWSPDGQHIAFGSNRQPDWDVKPGSDIYVMPASGGEARKLTETGGLYAMPVFSADGSRIAFAGNPDPDFVAPFRLFSIDRAGGNLRSEQGDWDGSLGHEGGSDVVAPAGGFDLQWRQDGIYFVGGERGVANVYRSVDGAVEPFTEGRHSITDFSMTSDGTMAYACADITHIAEIYLREPGGDVTQLTHENDAFYEDVRIAEPERFTFTGANGEESEGWILAPRGHETGKHPLIVYIHGGPMTAYGEVFFFEYQFLAAQGFGVFFPNIHGSSSYGRDYQTSIRGDWGNLDYKDVMAGTDAAVSRDWVDEQRMGIIGGSYGGYMTNWVMTHSDRFRAGIAERCLSNMVSFFGTMDFGVGWNRVTGAYPEEDIEKIWNMSPLKYVADVKGALMIMQYEGDNRTPMEQGEQMFNALRRLGKETKFIMVPEESHNFTRGGTPSRRVQRLGHIVEWFRRYL